MRSFRQECETSGPFMCCLLEEAGIHMSLSNRFVQKSPQLTEKGSLRGRTPNQGPSYLHMRGGTVANVYKVPHLHNRVQTKELLNSCLV